MGVCSSTTANGGRRRPHRHRPMHASGALTPHSQDARASSSVSGNEGAGLAGAPQPGRVPAARTSANAIVAVANLDDASSFAASVQGDGTSHRSKRKSLKATAAAGANATSSLPLAPIHIPAAATAAVTERTPIAGAGASGRSHPPTPSMSRSKRTPKHSKTSGGGSYKKLTGATVMAAAGGGNGRKSKSKRLTPQSELLLPGVDGTSAAESSCSGLGAPLTREERLAAGDRSALRLPGASGKSSPSPFELDHAHAKQKELAELESVGVRKMSTIRPVSSLRPEITSTPRVDTVTMGGAATPGADEDASEHMDLSGPPPLPERPRDHRSSHDALSDFHALTPPDKLSSRQKRKSASSKKSPNLHAASAVSSQGDSQEAPKQKRKWFRAIRHKFRLSKSSSSGIRALSTSLSGANDPRHEGGMKNQNLFISPAPGASKRGAEHSNTATYGNTASLAYTPGLVGHGAQTPTSRTDHATFATDTLRNRGSLTSVASRPSVTVVPLSTKNLRTHYENQKGAEKRTRVQITAQILEDNIQSSVAEEKLERQQQRVDKGSGSYQTDLDSLTSKTSSGVYDRSRRDQCKRAGARAFNNRRLSEAYSSVTTDSERYYDASGDHSLLSRHGQGGANGAGANGGGVHHAKHDSGSFASQSGGDGGSKMMMISRQNSHEKSKQRPVCFCAAAEALFVATQPLHVVMCDEYCAQGSSSRHRSSSPPTTIDLRDRPNRPSADAQRRRIAAKLYARRHHAGGHSSTSSKNGGAGGGSSQRRQRHRTPVEEPLPPLPTKPLPPVPRNGEGRSRSRQRPPTSWRPSLSKPMSANELNLSLDGPTGGIPPATANELPERHPTTSPMSSSAAVSLRQNTLLQQHQKRVGTVPHEIHRVDLSAGERLLHSNLLS